MDIENVKEDIKNAKDDISHIVWLIKLRNLSKNELSELFHTSTTEHIKTLWLFGRLFSLHSCLVGVDLVLSLIYSISIFVLFAPTDRAGDLVYKLRIMSLYILYTIFLFWEERDAGMDSIKED